MNHEMLDKSAKYIAGYADWFTKGIPTRKVYEAIEEVKCGRAIVIDSKTIKLTFRQKPLKQRVLERDHYTCLYCGNPGNTLDHVIPKSKGGLNVEDNCVCACRRCNQEKSNMPLYQFLTLLRQRKG